jgi:hypothetical protein
MTLHRKVYSSRSTQRPHRPNRRLYFGVRDYGSGRNCIEFGVGKGLTRAMDSCVRVLMLMHDL